jgi:outer membrane biosynthesis protein TonB
MEKKNRNKAIVGTVIFHVIAALLLILFAFKTPLPLPEEMGVIVDFGGGGGGGGESGKYTQMSSNAVSHDNTSPDLLNVPRENVVTQTDPSHAISKQTQTQPVVKEEPVVDPRIVDFWQSNKSNTSQGTGGGKGTGTGSGKGSGTGTGDGSGVGDGSGPGKGDGSGPNFSLHGRSSRYLPVPDYTEQDQGKVVVEVWVDRNGNVTKAIAGAKGTTTSNRSLWTKAQQAALNAKFSVNLNAPEEQKGTITYNFIRLGN